MAQRRRLWLQQWRWLTISGLTIAAAVAFAPQDVLAFKGWRWGGKPPDSTPRQTAPKAAPRNGFAAAIHKLQADARQKAQQGDLDGAISSAQRARKIAEASSALVAEDPACSIAAADRLVQELMAQRPAAPPPAMPSLPAATPPSATPAPTEEMAATANRSFADQLPIEPQPKAPAIVVRPFPKMSRSLTVFTPRPQPMLAEPLSVVATGWSTTAAAPQAAESLIESIEDATPTSGIAIAPQPTFVSLKPIARQSAESTPIPQAAEDDVSQQAAPASLPQRLVLRQAIATKPATAVGSPAAPVPGDGSDLPPWLPQGTPSVPPAEAAPPERSSSSGETPFVHPLESRIPPRGPDLDDEPAVVALNNSIEIVEARADAAFSQQHKLPREERVQPASAGQAAANEPTLTTAVAETTSEAAALVTPAAYLAATSISNGTLQTPALQSAAPPPPDHGVIDVPISITPVWFRDVQPVAASPSGSAARSPQQREALLLVEQVAAWVKLPVQTVTAWTAGLGFVLLGMGLCLMRFAVQPQA